MRVYRSPIRLFIFGLMGLLLIVAAMDVIFIHEVSTPPEMHDGVLNTRGQAQQRGDMVWGGLMLGVGVLVVGGTVIELARRRPNAVVSGEGLSLAIGPGEQDVVIPWDVVEEVRSDVTPDPYDGADREQLVITVSDRAHLPSEPIGATWDGNTLSVDAHGWTKRVTDIALRAQGTLAHHQRVALVATMEPPSLTWETTVVTAPGAQAEDSSKEDGTPGEESE